MHRTTAKVTPFLPKAAIVDLLLNRRAHSVEPSDLPPSRANDLPLIVTIATRCWPLLDAPVRRTAAPTESGRAAESLVCAAASCSWFGYVCL